MKVGLQTWGTDGDFYPFLALAIGLKNAGHEVTIAYTSIDDKDYSCRDDVHGIQLIKANLENFDSKNSNPYAINATAGSFKEYSILLRQYFDPHSEQMYAASERLCAENDIVIGHTVCHTLLTASQKFNCPRISLVPTPLVVRSKFVSPIGIQMGGFINSLLWVIGGILATKSWFKPANQIRKREGLSAIKSLQKELFTSDILTIVAASESLISRPADWAENIQMTGFLNLPSTDSNDWKMAEDLKVFVDAGEPPVYMTFGSCIQFDLEASTQLIVEAARLSGKRAIIQSDWSNLKKPADPNIYCIENAPHSKIFPHCSLIVHHGGAGTTQSALLAGKPSVVVAHGFDQSYWGKQLEINGVSGNVLNRNGITADELAKEINFISESQSASQKAAQIGEFMRDENGVKKVIELIDSIQLA
jgi:sterol 3beta-glucosyltransferase